jgi:hypothetical protein
MSIQATINVTAAWLCKHKPVVFTNRSKDQPLMADPFPIYQQVVRDNKAFFRDMHGYVPLPNTKTGLAGVRSRVYTELWRDKVILEALRIYRSRTEGASLDTVPECTYSQKPSCDGRANKSVAQRGIMGFEPAHARRGYIYNPDRNPNLLDMPAEVPPDRETCVLWDKEADSRNSKLEDEYYTALQAHLEALSTTTATAVPPAALKRKYMCGHCGVLKKGHVCPKATPKKRKGSSVRAVVKRMRK